MGSHPACISASENVCVFQDLFSRYNVVHPACMSALRVPKIFLDSNVLKFQDLISITPKKSTLKVNLVVDARTFTIYILCAL